MGRRPGEIGKQRREQIIEAAVAIIAEEGLPKLSLSAIEERTGMSRGQLTYYFPNKEDILLAVFDHMIEVMKRGAEADGQFAHLKTVEGWDRVVAFLSFFVLQPPDVPEFQALQYTFLSQVGHRDDFRQRLANLYEHWRSEMTADLSADVKALPANTKPQVSARTVASFIQAVLHGLLMQRVADPEAYDRHEMRLLFLDLLSTYLDKPFPEAHAGNTPSKTG